MHPEYIQLDMFNNTEMDFVKEEIKLCFNKFDLSIKRSDNVRRGLFARHNELEKRIQNLETDNENLKKCMQEILGVIEEIKFDKEEFLNLKKYA